MTAKEKGDFLEGALEFVERKVFEENHQGLKGAKISFQRNLSILNERHKIDFVVDTELDDILYKARYVFECKNWNSEPIDKKEVAAFLLVVKESKATKGIMVGKKITSHASLGLVFKNGILFLFPGKKKGGDEKNS